MPERPHHTISHDKDGSILVKYQPVETGNHEVNIAYNEKPLEGTPFRCIVDKSLNVTAYGDGLYHGISNENSSFTVVGGVGVDIAINGPSKADIVNTVKAENGMVYTYMPYSPGEYILSVFSDGKHIHGSPFSAKISGEGRKRSQCSLAGTSDYTLGGKEVEMAGISANIKSPDGSYHPVLLKKMPDGKLGLSGFSPKQKGGYQIDVLQDGQKFPGSPFLIDIKDNTVANPGKVVATGAITKAESQKWNELSFDLTDAGHGSVTVSIEGPHRCDMEKVKPEGKKFTIKYKPHEPGIYVLNLRFAEEHLPMSPCMVSVGGKPSGRVREDKEIDVQKGSATGPGSKCEFSMKIPGTNPLEMDALLTSPSGKTEPCEIRDAPNNMYLIKFSPKEIGVHIVSLKHRGLHISGSPFQYSVGDSPAAGAYKVEVGGPGLEHGEVGRPCEFNIYTREAGAGKLAIGIEGPSKAELVINDLGAGFTIVDYTVAREGDYAIHIKYNGEHVPESPLNVHIVPHSEGANLVTVSGIRDRGLEIGKPITFQIEKNGAEGELKAHCDTPTGNEEDVFIQEMDRDLYALRCIPKDNGVHYIHLKLDEAHIQGSPFPLLVGKLGADPALVMSSGDGLTRGAAGTPSVFRVTTLNAGAGNLFVSVTGPSKVAIQCTEVDEGYECSYTPMAPGDYVILIKYSNVTIAGSPSKAKVTGTGKTPDLTETSSLAIETTDKKPGQVTKKKFIGDASKVVVKGTGLKKLFANRPGTITVDVAGAGNAMFSIGMMSPTGNPVEEVTYKKTRATSYTVNLKTKEKGEHSLNIRWGNDDVPGSPFTIPVA